MRRATSGRTFGGQEYRYFYPRSPCGERQYQLIKSSIFTLISIHALLAESDIDMISQPGCALPFLSTLSLRRATTDELGTRLCDYCISIHALLAESDPKGSVHDFKLEEFLSTLSLRRATLATWQPGHVCRDFYPRSPCGERQENCMDGYKIVYISIHALLAESDAGILAHHARKIVFLSTLSLRRATY